MAGTSIAVLESMPHLKALLEQNAEAKSAVEDAAAQAAAERARAQQPDIPPWRQAAAAAKARKAARQAATLAASMQAAKNAKAAEGSFRSGRVAFSDEAAKPREAGTSSSDAPQGQCNDLKVEDLHSDDETTPEKTNGSAVAPKSAVLPSTVPAAKVMGTRHNRTSAELASEFQMFQPRYSRADLGLTVAAAGGTLVAVVFAAGDWAISPCRACCNCLCDDFD